MTGRKQAGLEVCIVGAGPRGLSVLERLCANERARPSHDAVTVHVIDPAAPGAGAVWRQDQSQHLLMNTVASQITVYTDDSSRIDGPIEPGPSLYGWAAEIAAAGAASGQDEACLAEARALGPNTYPSRAFYGRYLNACFRQVIDGAPAHVTVVVHRSRAVAMADTHGIPGGPQGIRLEDGSRLNELDAIVLAQGHVAARPTPHEERTASLARIHHLTYLTPANPADLDLSGIEPGQNVLLRGLGLNFFDHMALFTIGRGGSFERVDERLVYRPSGREPKLFAWSRRGIPYHARGENEKGAYGRYYPRLLTAEYIAGLRRRAAAGEPVHFRTDLWPLISREVESVYYGTLLDARGRGAEREDFVQRYLTVARGDGFAFLCEEYGITEAERWDWDRLFRPYGDREFTGPEDFRDWLLDYLALDVEAARAGNLSGPLKAALDVLRDLRNEIRQAVDHGGLEGTSHRDDLEGWYTPLNAFLSIGPPVSRIEELIALIEAGVVELSGPGTEIRIDTGTPCYVLSSTKVPRTPVRATVLIEARLPEPDLRRTTDPLLQHLLSTEQATAYRIPAQDGSSYETGGLAVTERPYRLLDTRGRAHPRRYAYGVPTESVHWVTAAGIRPGVDSVTLGDSDAIARAVLALSPAAEVPAAVRPGADVTDLTGVLV
ncbi:FAD/NAD(P)-binding domain-containing protein [Streptomyces rubellomurinus]|uniref:FAD binding domain-containing protein n=2 Tax=Streptomyces TaxID=1883 RepID=A0A0F2TG24_STRR3|nr:FAD/NAD(P)-binding protein [Streptomyces rubellomurinus]KJS53301.1 FAD binding domain-containing protein [Streptomyces rubellomurinus subsp. indigoferus]KJS62124.1 FAD binding domain-containing protein [Streptomyces rubellomurinus]